MWVVVFHKVEEILVIVPKPGLCALYKNSLRAPWSAIHSTLLGAQEEWQSSTKIFPGSYRQLLLHKSSRKFPPTLISVP